MNTSTFFSGLFSNPKKQTKTLSLIPTSAEINSFEKELKVYLEKATKEFVFQRAQENTSNFSRVANYLIETKEKTPNRKVFKSVLQNDQLAVMLYNLLGDKL